MNNHIYSRIIGALIFLFILTACGPSASDVDELFGPGATTPPEIATAQPASQATQESATSPSTSATTPTPTAEIILTPDTARFPVWVWEGVVLGPSDFGVEAGKPVADATVAQLPDGQYRIFVFAQDQGIRSAISSDGLTFTVEEGLRVEEGGFGMPRVVPLDDGGWRLYGINMGGIGSAISSDGLNFTIEPGLRLEGVDYGVDALSVGSIVEAPQGGYRMYFSDLPRAGAPPSGHTVFSAYSEDGLTWTPEPNFQFGAVDETDLSGSAEHPFVLRDEEGLYWMFYFQQLEIWTATSIDGITWQNEKPTGLRGNDPEIVVRPDGEWWMYYGDFDPAIGGFIQVARRTWTTWDITVESTGGGPGYFTFTVSVVGSSEKPIELQIEGVDIELPPPSNALPFDATFNLPMESMFSPDGRSLTLLANDGTIERRLSLAPPPPG